MILIIVYEMGELTPITSCHMSLEQELATSKNQTAKLLTITTSNYIAYSAEQGSQEVTITTSNYIAYSLQSRAFGS
jgi:hypothetical protein